VAGGSASMAATALTLSIGTQSLIRETAACRLSASSAICDPAFSRAVSSHTAGQPATHVYRTLEVEASKPSRREKVKVTHARIRKKLNGTPERPRLAVFRSHKHIYAQVIDDTKMVTVASASTVTKALREELQLSAGPTVAAAKRVGEELAKSCLQLGITKVAFDRGGFLYHGRIKALADGAREAGLDF